MFLIILLFVSHLTKFGNPTPFISRSGDNAVIHNDVEGDFISLFSFGKRLFGEPSSETGRKVDAWTADSEVHPEELGSYLEGDILHPSSNARNGIIGISSRWVAAIIPYEFSPQFDATEQKTIRDAMEQFHKLTCIRFVEHSSNPRLNDYIYIDKAQTGCWSSVGRVGGRQVVNLQSPGCLSTLGTPIHELMHAVGFLHEQNRWERDNHITIKWENIQKGREANFEKSTKEMSDALGVAYDYRSVMHYSPFAFSSNGGATIVTSVPNVDIGQRIGLSRKDVQKIYRMYNCQQYGDRK